LIKKKRTRTENNTLGYAISGTGEAATIFRRAEEGTLYIVQ